MVLWIPVSVWAIQKEMVILKLDFEKAFDKFKHDLFFNILQHNGFGPKWLKWIKMIMDSGTSAILMNGNLVNLYTVEEELDRVIHFHQSFFVLVVDLLLSIINSAKDLGLLTLPQQQRCG